MKPRKVFVCNMCMLNWYRYSVYQAFDSKDNMYFIAEPQQPGGGTKCADTLDELKNALMLDAMTRQKAIGKVR